MARVPDNPPVDALKTFLASPAGKFISKYVIILGVGFFVLALRPVSQRVVYPYTTFVANEARVALNLFREHASVSGQVLSSPRFSVAIHNGCNGLEAILIFVCGVMAFPAPWAGRIIGALLGFLAIQVFNVVRVVSLFYVGIYLPQWFNVSHIFIWQSLVIILAVVLWLGWVHRYAVAKAQR
jgi:exosortase H (IPTLxxWG-CTERM-specific)